ncbi:B2 protein [Anoplophora glabripennis]|uniref:B2 protein n=1 Tax=Anoplophora glabripennis TaxID=217634 RepID=UPI0008757F63|nr:B2 protein [Anoplophora glabripennis]
MKLVIAAVVLTLFIVVKAELTLEQLKKLKDHRENCIKESGADPEVVAKARTGNIAEDPKLQEHLLCMFKRIGFMSEEGKIQRDVLRRKLVDVIKDEELADKLIGECVVEASTSQLTALESFKCFFTKTGLPIV